MPESGTPILPVILLAVGMLAVMFVTLLVYASRYVKVGPNTALVVSGRRQLRAGPDGRPRIVGFRIVRGGGTFVWPIFEKAETLSLEERVLTLHENDARASTGVRMQLRLTVRHRIAMDPAMLERAAERLLHLPEKEVEALVEAGVRKPLCAVVATLKPEDILASRAKIAETARTDASHELSGCGLEVVSVGLDSVDDELGCIDALVKADAACVRRDAIIAEAEANREIDRSGATVRCAVKSCGFPNPARALFCCRCASPIGPLSAPPAK